MPRRGEGAAVRTCGGRRVPATCPSGSACSAETSRGRDSPVALLGLPPAAEGDTEGRPPDRRQGRTWREGSEPGRPRWSQT